MCTGDLRKDRAMPRGSAGRVNGVNSTLGAFGQFESPPNWSRRLSTCSYRNPGCNEGDGDERW